MACRQTRALTPKRRLIVCLLAGAVLTGCAPLSRIEPSFGHAAQVSLVAIDDQTLAVDLSDIRKPGGEALDIPGSAFYLLPGKYFVHLTCRRPLEGNAQPTAPDGLDDNYSLIIEPGKRYELDCSATEKGSQFVLWDVTPPWPDA